LTDHKLEASSQKEEETTPIFSKVEREFFIEAQ